MKTRYLQQLHKLIQHLDQAQPGNMETAFVHGSWASGNEKPDSYQEQMYFHDGKLWFSIFRLLSMPADVDIIITARRPNDLLAELEKTAKRFLNDDYFLTANIISPDEYDRVVRSVDAMAPKRLLVVRELMILKGEEAIARLKAEAKQHYGELDDATQTEYDNKKQVMRQLREARSDKYVLTREDYQQTYPHLLEELEGARKGGFSIKRTKYVFPRSMDLKYRVDIETYKEKYLD